MLNSHEKVTAGHLRRNAYLYIRQSTLKQLAENQESAKRQYNLKDRAIALGWPKDQVIVIDSDTGQSGAESQDREGFQRLVAEVGMGKAGIVMGLEVSRLARNCADWHRLIEICALADTLILDEDGIYDPGHFNDRLLLGMKGTMSEAELHVLRARLRGGVLNKARRGELKLPLPVGFVYEDDKVILDPNSQIQESIRFFHIPPDFVVRLGESTSGNNSQIKEPVLSGEFTSLNFNTAEVRILCPPLIGNDTVHESEPMKEVLLAPGWVMESFHVEQFSIKVIVCLV
jgi:DNA invertase Pin-like site-specific DNA recombinase